MKVESNIFGPEIARGGRSSNQRAESGASFADLLAQAVGQDGGAQAGAVAEVTSAAPAAIGGAQPPAIWGELNGLLDSLESYAQALGNPGVSLKQLEPLAADLERRAEALEAGLAAGEADGLSGLAQEALTQARVEAIKFRRGDYV
ncbi:MAG: hypothetical protein ACOZHQ_18040 [Thermodesulfobacteriota bacterium]